MSFLSLIERKRDGGHLSPEDIKGLVDDCVRGTVPDYQLAALLMAIYFEGMDQEETRVLTRCMRGSGEVLEFGPGRPVVDKHSTGGIGDKVSLILAPLLACLGFRVPMISGRGLGITGGTLDKLESIPGFRTQLTARQIVEQVDTIGVAMAGQTETMCPADRRLYALRDATGTVPSVPLITASILSKKLAEGLSALVLDVKFGAGAFMQTLEHARELARSLTTIANECGIKTRCVLTDMNAPLGHAAGNWLEVKEAVRCLEGSGPPDVCELVIECAAQLLVLSGLSGELSTARDRAKQVLASGAPRRKWDDLVCAQGGDVELLNDKFNCPTTAPVVIDVTSGRGGFVTRCDARIIGEVVRDLGGGRVTKDAVIDHDVGVDQIAKPGADIASGAVLCRIHARVQHDAKQATARLEAAFEVSSTKPAIERLLVEIF